MKKKTLMIILVVAALIPLAVVFSSCTKGGAPAETGITVFLSGSPVGAGNNTIEITYGDYQSAADVLQDYITVNLDFDDGSKQSLSRGDGGYSVAGLPQSLKANEAGYDLTVSYKDYKVGLKLVVGKAQIDMSGVGWTYGEFDYDGKAHGVELDNLPDGVTASYTDNSKTDAGEYTAVATLNYDSENYSLVNLTEELSKQWTINKASIDMFAVSWGETVFTYDGSAKTTELINLPDGITVTYRGNTATAAGEYTATATLVYDENNCEPVNVDFELSKSWKINKAVIDLSGARWNYGGSNFVYDQTEKTVTITGLPAGVTASYTGNSHTNAGQYTAVAALDYDSLNFVLANQNFGLTLEWEIHKAQISAGQARWNYTEAFTYDGTEKSVAVVGLPEGLTVTGYNGTAAATNASTYTVSPIYGYDELNYSVTGAPGELTWTINKAVNTVSGSIVLSDRAYGDAAEAPAGLTAVYGDIEYKFFTKTDDGAYAETAAPTALTDAGTYYVAGFSSGDDNYTAQQSEYKEFVIYPKEVPFDLIGRPSVKLDRNSFIYTGAEFAPAILNLPDDGTVTVSGDLAATEIGNYAITFALNDKTNYRWKLTDGLTAEDRTVPWSIIANPVEMTLNGIVLSTGEFEALSELNIGDEWAVTVESGYVWSLYYEYKNPETGDFGSSDTSDTGFTVSPTYYSFEFRISKNGERVYTKTVSVNHDVFESVTAGGVSMTFEQFAANPAVEYGTEVSFNLKAEYSGVFAFSHNSFAVTENITVAITYETAGMTRTYATVEIVCLFDPVESITIGESTVSYDEFIAHPVIRYGEYFKINLKPGYEGFYSSWAEGSLTEDATIYIYSGSSAEVLQFDVICNSEFLLNIDIDGEQLSFDELCDTRFVVLGKTLSFTVNEEFADLYEVCIRENYESDEVVSGDYSFAFTDFSAQLNIYIKNVKNPEIPFSISLNVILIENIEVNGKQYALTSTYFTYDKDFGETSFTIVFDEKTITDYELYYRTDLNSERVRMTQTSITLSAADIERYMYVYLAEDMGETQVLSIELHDFTPIDSVVLYSAAANSDNIPNTWSSEWSGTPELTVRGVIENVKVVYREGYEHCTSRIFDAQGTEITDFTRAVGGIYTFKIYLGGEEIYSIDIYIAYDMSFVFPDTDIQNVDGADVPVLVTTSATLSREFEDTDFYSGQSITFDGEPTKALSAGQNKVDVVYKVTVKDREYTFNFQLFVEYNPEDDPASNYVKSIEADYVSQWGGVNTVVINNFEGVTPSWIDLAGLVRMSGDDIRIELLEGNTLISKNLVILTEANRLSYIEYTVLTAAGDEKTYRVYLNTSGRVSDNVNARFTFEPMDSPVKDVTSQIQDDTLIIDKINMSATIRIITEDPYTYHKYYYNGELITGSNYGYLDLNKAGTYKIEIISSDNTATRTVTVIVWEYSALVLEMFYGEERLYIEEGSGAPGGNMEMFFGTDGNPGFIGYFGNKNPEDVGTVTLSGQCVFADNIFMPDMTRVTDFSAITLPLMTDADGSVTQVAGAEYTYLNMYVGDGITIKLIFVFAEAPTAP